MSKEILDEPNLQKLREIILEPDFELLANRVAKIEKNSYGADANSVEQTKKDIAGLKNDFIAMRKEIEEIQTVIVALNRKLTNAFGSFIKAAGE
jgi:hypothetical protein